MDIFVRNIPDQATNKNLKKFFQDQFRPFGIEEFYCEKLRSRGCATLTVLDAAKAQHFLGLYGEPSQAHDNRTRTRKLRYMNRDIFCAPSKSKSDQILLQTLRKDEKDRRKSSHISSSVVSSTKQVDRAFDYNFVQCGHWDYQALDLVFVSQYTDTRKGSIKFGKKNLALVAHSNASGRATYRLDVPSSTIWFITTGTFQDPSLTLTLSEAPRIYQDPASETSSLHTLFGGLNIQSKKSKRRRVTSLGDDHAKVRSGCFVYRILMSNSSHIRQIGRLLQQDHEMPPSILWPTTISTPRSLYASEMDRLTLALQNQYEPLGFGLLFQVQRLAQNGYLSPGRVLDFLPHILQVFLHSEGVMGAEVVRKLSRQLPYAGPESDGKKFSTEYLKELLVENMASALRELSSKAGTQQRPSHIGLVHKANVTPAGIYLEGPEPETTNRVLRAYPDHADHFLRATFCDEDGERMRFDRFVSLEEIFHFRFKNVLDGAISIAGRRFEVLGFSHSSLRDQTCWFMAPFMHHGVLLNASAVIAKLGDFSAIRCPAKCAARIGQAFSTTDGSVKIPEKAICKIPDVERNGRVFSDGVGTISKEILAMLWEDYIPAKKSRPTLFQIRFGGAKGMISLDTRLKGKVLSLRPSMVKFGGSNSLDLEICGSGSRPLPLFLNRQNIKILEDLGVDSEVFMELQSDAVERLRRTTLSSANAANFLERELVGKIARVPWLIRRLDDIGFDFLDDAFLRRTVELAVLSQLRELKHRSRILVEQGVTLYGIMDETNTLAEGEIYCCTDRNVILGTVTITRAPALHPGDVQVANAVDVPDDSPLNSLHNCIVFSQRGRRDLPSQLSGGDLDGDLYNVIYDRRLLPSRVFTPADYPRVSPKDIGRPVTRKDMTDFFIEFMENDQLGRIALLHMQLADVKDGGTQHPDCITLAEMHSTAVDFSKTGIRVDMGGLPKYDFWRPDFMAPSPRVTIEKGIWALEHQPLQSDAEDDPDPVIALDPDVKTYRYYESPKVLGKLYRAIDEKSFLAELQKRGHGIDIAEHSEQTLIHRLWAYVQVQTYLVQWEHHTAWAREIREGYETQLVDTIYQFSTPSTQLISELEVFVGTLLGKNGGLRTKRLRDMSVGMKEKYERDLAFTIHCIVEGSEDEGNHEALERSIACFAAAMEDTEVTWERIKRLESFRYVAAAVCLGEVERFQKNLGL